MGFSRKSFAGAQTLNNEDRLPIDSTNSPFYFVHSPLSWFFVETQHGFELLPTVTAVSRQAGLGGMEMKRGGGVDDMMWLAKKTREENCIVIPMDYKYDDENGYMNEWKNKSGKSYYTDRWTTPDRVGNKIIWTTDDNAIYDFLRHLVHTGEIPLPHEVVINGIKQRLTRRIESRINTAAINADVRAKKEKFEYQLSLIDSALENLIAKKTPTQKKKKAKS
tara:strand:- start:1375 stop:2037 length:663 start_codon:yes stop_codon:yes gene_type:complete